jgi:hypothetical protein
MCFRPAILVLSAALLLTSGAGCQRSGSRAAAPPTVLPPATIASVHWLGQRRLGYEATAFFFMRVWNRPETARLEKQTLTKLAADPGEWLPGGAGLTADARSRLSWLLNDLVQEESYLEIRAATNSPSGTVFAIRLNAAQAGQWQTNLPVLLEPLTGGRTVFHPITQGWSLKTTSVLDLIQLSRIGDWTIVSAGPDNNPLADEITARIRRDGVPFVSAGTNLWLEAGLELPRLARIFPRSAGGGVGNPSIFSFQLSTLNHLDLAVSGDGGNVITRGQLTFLQPLPASLEPWRLPVALMHEPLTSFTAVRGLRSWLAGSQWWRDLQIGAAPDQLFFWSLAGSPYQAYLAAPLPDATHQVAALTEHLMQKGNPWLATNGYISFDRAADGDGVTWGDLPDIRPFLKAAGTGADGWLFAGLLPDTNNAAAPPPAGMLQDVLRRPNLVYYDWQTTGLRLQPDLQLGQTARQLARRAPMTPDSASLGWLGLLMPRLGTSATIINRPAPDRLTFVRRATLGMTAPELHLLADWLESPRFPRGLHSTP